MKYLDLNGLGYLLNRIKEKFLPTAGGTVSGDLTVDGELNVNSMINNTDGRKIASVSSSETQLGNNLTKLVLRGNTIAPAYTDGEGNQKYLATLPIHAPLDPDMLPVDVITYDSVHGDTKSAMTINSGYGIAVGNDSAPLEFMGSENRPTYNSNELALNDEVAQKYLENGDTLFSVGVKPYISVGTNGELNVGNDAVSLNLSGANSSLNYNNKELAFIDYVDEQIDSVVKELDDLETSISEKFIVLTEEEYNSLSEKNPSVFYFIKE